MPVLYLFAPVQTTCVLLKLVLNPDMIAMCQAPVMSLQEFDRPRKTEASSAD